MEKNFKYIYSETCELKANFESNRIESNRTELYRTNSILSRRTVPELFDYFCIFFKKFGSVRSNRIDQLDIIQHRVRLVFNQVRLGKRLTFDSFTVAYFSLNNRNKRKQKMNCLRCNFRYKWEMIDMEWKDENRTNYLIFMRQSQLIFLKGLISVTE